MGTPEKKKGLLGRKANPAAARCGGQGPLTTPAAHGQALHRHRQQIRHEAALHQPLDAEQDVRLILRRVAAAGEATGAGKTTWFKYNQWHIVETGEMRGGRMEGWWERRWYAGRLEESLWQGGVKIAVQGPAQSPGYGNGQYNSRSDPGPSLGDRAMETLERQRRENCAAVAEGRNRGGCYGQ